MCCNSSTMSKVLLLLLVQVPKLLSNIGSTHSSHRSRSPTAPTFHCDRKSSIIPLISNIAVFTRGFSFFYCGFCWSCQHILMKDISYPFILFYTARSAGPKGCVNRLKFRRWWIVGMLSGPITVKQINQRCAVIGRHGSWGLSFDGTFPLGSGFFGIHSQEPSRKVHYTVPYWTQAGIKYKYKPVQLIQAQCVHQKCGYIVNGKLGQAKCVH